MTFDTMKGLRLLCAPVHTNANYFHARVQMMKCYAFAPEIGTLQRFEAFGGRPWCH